ncbi:D-alanyl-D-alanine carboxypeptidase [hydrothermal vent metagenome]|uniref:D-alanyl-D-alanine carboxypeptidase n=1 Tax=hydrothermal vent metagenome TaxID=652676 RepID=A0A3B0ZHZ0_9ZZZZ
MDRRKVLGYLSAIGIAGIYGSRLLTSESTDKITSSSESDTTTMTGAINSVENSIVKPEKPIKVEAILKSVDIETDDTAVVDYLYKIQHFNNDFKSDVFLEPKNFLVLKRLSRRLNRAQKIIGYLNFSILDFPLLVRYSKNYPAIGKFTSSELDLVDELISRSAQDYGFYGDKLITNVNDKIPAQDLSKISSSGQYLYKDAAYSLYKRIQDDVGERVILTSGVRGLMKQLQLFTAKAVKTQGNLSRASRSLAPPGHSYHGVGDFDIGDIKLGKMNFTEKFSDTDIYKKLVDLGYIKIRYRSNNKFGVRYEPWHIKVS